mmetsp:Transcript_60591/g.131494  ORF Transcript_60591/g.131494 Transcript_60591/m.131494 type:complete len:116 (-) Transcript_60591:130-477(-)
MRSSSLACATNCPLAPDLAKLPILPLPGLVSGERCQDQLICVTHCNEMTSRRRDCVQSNSMLTTTIAAPAPVTNPGIRRLSRGFLEKARKTAITPRVESKAMIMCVFDNLPVSGT